MDNILYDVYFDQSTNKVFIASEGSDIKEIRDQVQLLSQTEGSDNARHLVSILEAVNPNLEIITIDEE